MANHAVRLDPLSRIKLQVDDRPRCVHGRDAGLLLQPITRLVFARGVVARKSRHAVGASRWRLVRVFLRKLAIGAASRAD
jgi:hypothetical protein